MDTSASSFGQWLRLRRQALYLTQQQLGTLAGCSPALIRKIEADERRPSTQIAERLAQVLKLAPEERVAFVKTARGELAADRLAIPARSAMDAPRQTRPATTAPLPHTPAFPALLRRFRLAANLSQEALADKAGLSDRAISALERGVNRTPRQATVALLADALALSQQQRSEFITAAYAAREPALTVEPAPFHTLPTPPTPLIGREHELHDLTTLLSSGDARLITLVGPGGVGKTRLALQVAAASLDHFRDGVVVVELETVHDPGFVAPTIARELGIVPAAAEPPVHALKRVLRTKQLLLVLDNFEQVVTAAPQIAELMRAAAALTVLVTSRAALHVRGEHQYAVLPLMLPDLVPLPPRDVLGRIAAVALFVERVREHTRGFALSEEQARVIAEICVRLDGLPLALELAAARMKVFSPSLLLARLDQRFQLLTGGARDLPARQQTLRATIDWSYSLLAEAEQRVFVRLSVFSGGWTVAAAEAVCGATPDILESLVDKSLVRVTAPADGGEPRFSMLATIHDYVRERLEASGEAEEMQRRRAAACLQLATAADAAFELGRAQTSWLRRLEEEYDNLRGALNWLLTTDRNAALQLAGALGLFWFMQGYNAEGRRWLEAALTTTQTPDRRSHTKALLAFGLMLVQQGDGQRAIESCMQSLQQATELGDERLIARALNGLGHTALQQGNIRAARAPLEEAYQRAQQAQSVWDGLRALGLLGSLAVAEGDYAGAAALLAECLARATELGEAYHRSLAVYSLGGIAVLRGETREARAYLEAGLELWREARGNMLDSHAGEMLGRALVAEGDTAGGIRRITASLQRYEERGSTICIAHALEGVARVALAQRQAEHAARMLGAAQGLLDRLHMASTPIEQALFNQSIAQAKGALDSHIFAARHAEGATMTTEQAVMYALAFHACPDERG